ncbi:contact-dependent growth inhibition system immunity protein [Paraburkholderia caballeronis]|nr:contact-dependent growth inhibition system immunity protein [Paraburkholderia caballeronis]SEC64993.1 hypothetical protein SAMN05445871_2599 [Paraburkholderia caballeronis]
MKYENLNQLIRGRFNEDFDLWGNSIPELVLSFKNGCPRSMIDATAFEIDQFKTDNAGNLDAAFEREFGKQCSPPLWGHTTDSFLEELKRLLSE